jgi:hypothetical protein
LFCSRQSFGKYEYYGDYIMSYIGNSLPANFQSLPAVQRFNGTGSATAFTLAAQIANDQSILVSVDGVTQDSNAYAVSGTTLTFTAAPSAGTGNIFVNTISPVGSTVVPPDGSVTKVKTDFFISQATAPSSPSEGDIWFNSSASTVSGIVTKTMASYSGSKWEQMSNRFSVTGGTITTSGSYTIHTFTSSGTLVVTGDGTVDYLTVAGGGGGGKDDYSGNRGGGGGGAGGYRTASSFNVSSQSYTITVGAGGAPGNASNETGTNGGDSVFSTVTSTGGGGGGGHSASANEQGSAGGSGGGGSNGQAGGAGTAGQGNTGGTGGPDAPYMGAGGGGASAVGASVGSGQTAGGAGGAGTASSISGSSVTYAGGGGGGGGGGSAGGAGGSGGGGAGSTTSTGTSGTANTGGGGGGTRGTPGTGGSGVVIIRYLT